MNTRLLLSFNPLATRWQRTVIAGTSLGLMLLSALISHLVIEHQQHDNEQELHQHVSLAAQEKRALIERDLSSVTQLTSGVISYISQNQANQYELESANLRLILSVLYQYAPHVRSMAIAPGNRILYVYPQPGNELLLGLYYPDLKQQWPDVQRAIRQRTPVLTGPINLVQGGQGLALRTPVFLRNGEYWGVLSVIIDSDRLLRKVDLTSDAHIEYALRDPSKRNTIIFGSPALFSEDSVRVGVAVSGGTWQLAARPRAGWQVARRGENTARLLAAGVTLMLGGLCAWLLVAIAARQRTQEGLRLSQFTLEQAPESILWLNAQGEVVYRNKAAFRLPQRQEAEGAPLFLWDFLPGLSREDWSGIWQQLRDKGHHRLFGSRQQQGRQLHLETSFNHLPYAGNELAVSFTRDVSEQKQVEEALRSSSLKISEALARARRLAYIVSRTKSAVLLTDVQGRVTWGNQAFCDLSGHTLEEVLGRKPGEFLQGPRTNPGVVRHMGECLQRQQGFRVEILNYRKDGVPFWLDLEVQPIFSESGVIEGFMAVQTDISAHKRSEQRLEEAQRIAQMGFWEYDVEAGTGLWSVETYRIYDLPPATPISMETLRLVVHPEDYAGVEAGLQKAIAQEGLTVSHECRIVRNSGEVRHVRHIGRRMPGDQTQRIKLFGTVQDITEQKRAESLKNEFVSVVSHELRTPLTSIRGALGLLELLQEPGNEQARQLLDLANRNSERLLLLINDLLDMEKLSYGKMQFVAQQQALAPLLQQAMQTNQPYASRYGIRFVLQDDMPGAQVRVDGHRLQQVLANLLSNAAKFSGEDTPGAAGGRVDIVVLPSGDAVRVCVQDYGPGIEPGKHERIFQSFSQLDSSNSRARGGTGLGLAICRALVERMGGRIGFCSVPGAGSTFWFELPLASTAGAG